MANRVFISHSATGEPETGRLRDELAAELRTEFEVRVDRDDLEPGDMWRSKINSWLGGCHAAVALLTPKALDSAYVFYELSVLASRPDVFLFPVLLDGATDKTLKEKKQLEPTLVRERNAIIDSRDVDENGLEGLHEPERARRKRARLVGLIKNALLAKREQMGGSTPVDEQADGIVGSLETLRSRPARAARHVTMLDPQADTWEQAGDIIVKLAHRLMSAGVEGAAPVLADMIDDVGPGAVLTIFGRVATSWVDLKAAQYVKSTATRGDLARRALAVNGEEALIAKLYVQRASGRASDTNWRVAESSGVLSEAALTDAKAKVEEALMVALNVKREALKAELRNRERILREPVFVTLEAAGVNSTLMAGLREAFPTVTYFFLAGSSPDHRGALRGVDVEYILPELEEGFEQEFCDVYNYVRNKFCELNASSRGSAPR